MARRTKRKTSKGASGTSTSDDGPEPKRTATRKLRSTATSASSSRKAKPAAAIATQESLSSSSDGDDSDDSTQKKPPPAPAPSKKKPATFEDKVAGEMSKPMPMVVYLELNDKSPNSFELAGCSVTIEATQNLPIFASADCSGESLQSLVENEVLNTPAHLLPPELASVLGTDGGKMPMPGNEGPF